MYMIFLYTLLTTYAFYLLIINTLINIIQYTNFVLVKTI